MTKEANITELEVVTNEANITELGACTAGYRTNAGPRPYYDYHDELTIAFMFEVRYPYDEAATVRSHHDGKILEPAKDGNSTKLIMRHHENSTSTCLTALQVTAMKRHHNRPFRFVRGEVRRRSW